ncbi:PREDICTED: heat shock factor-binding protein 1-like protein 1 [Tinamus guttatus]|uniref:heat shock factor-binding protein 1-like protein 1 n=1 Tax=Tinamus guttatus TaxID=94827 RepID=UPI00052E8506|nr:PREDICTED: heat shock factor-binding protein 1-like protein 1 [Tinamus guttatus]
MTLVLSCDQLYIASVTQLPGLQNPSLRPSQQLAENRLYQLQEDFQALTEKITLRMEEMGERIDDLEKHVAELMAEAGVENTSEDLRH